MKKSLLFLTLTFFTYSEYVNAQGTLTPEILYYKFDGSGTNVPNFASNPPAGTINATLMGGVTQGGSNYICDGTLIGNGLSGTGNYLNTGWATGFGTGSWTISFRSSGISTNITIYYAFGDSVANSIRCFTNGVAGPTNWILRATGLNDVNIAGGALMTPTMVTYAYDSAAAVIKGYLNGVLYTTIAQTPGSINISGPGPFKVNGYGSKVGAPAGGLIDEFRVYDRPLTDTEVLQLYNPFPAGFLGPDQYICPDFSDFLSINHPATTVLWSTGSTLDSNLITSPGSYFVNVSGTCGSGTDTIEFISSLNTNVTQSGSSGEILTANSSGTYNWIDCNTLIPVGVTTATFVAAADGEYAVIVDDGTCSDTSSCFIVAGINIEENDFKNSIKIYPVPTNGKIYVSISNSNQNFALELMNSVGQVVQKNAFSNTSNVTMDVTGTSGLYFIRISNNNGQKALFKIIKE